jgi:predicted nuclease of predicted toxin-antitoxin system
MSKTIRFHLDEHCSHAIASGLRLRGIDVTTTTDLGLIGPTDKAQLAEATRQDRVLVTHDADFIVLHNRAVHHSGVVCCHQNRHSVGEVIRRLVSIWSIHDGSDLTGRLTYL